ncbi:MAG: hypothetical protein KDA41_17855, partial [Planctomycetales bacterium]|nr:hypothetical protein [Planctomycetales bacterium]
MNVRKTIGWMMIAAALWAPHAVAAATPGSETVLPATTKLWLSLPDIDASRAAFDASQIGKLANDPKMEKFIDELIDDREGQGR